eukprot:235906-Hanusia_phi.AAC.1
MAVGDGAVFDGRAAASSQVPGEKSGERWMNRMEERLQFSLAHLPRQVSNDNSSLIVSADLTLSHHTPAVSRVKPPSPSPAPAPAPAASGGAAPFPFHLVLPALPLLLPPHHLYLPSAIEQGATASILVHLTR